MFVYFYEEKEMVLNQIRNTVPAVGENVKIKGRKGTVLSVEHEDENKVHVHLGLEKVKKSKVVEDPSKKRKR